MSWTAKPSVQRMSVPAAPLVVATHYFNWVDEKIPFVCARQTDDRVSFHILGIDRAAIALEVQASDADNVIYIVVGGFLTRSLPERGEFSFARTSGKEITIALRRFAPRLPRFIYVCTHAVVHEIVMGLYVRRQDPLLLGEDP